MTSIANDTSRAELPNFCLQLIQLSKIYGDAKRESIKLKNWYEREFIMKKESNRQIMEDMEEARFIEELKDNPKAKKNKITNVDIESMTSLKLIWLKDDLTDAQMIVAYLDPLIKWYYERIQAIKFTSRQQEGFTSIN